MAAWLLTISKDYPQHWQYAKKHGLWDLITPRGIRAGDVVYYWQSGASLLGKVRVLRDASEIDAEHVTPGPWDDWPGAEEKPYVQRFPLEVLAGEAIEQPRWHDVAAATGLPKNPTFVRTLKPEQQAVLDAYLGGDVEPQQSLSDAQRERIFADLDEDLRVRRLQLVALRQGQPRFRGDLVRAYSGRCAITGTAIESVLEAAHISPHKGEHTNEVWNGLLLRADIHTLFDLFLVTVEATTMRVRISPALAGSEYESLDGDVLNLPGRLDEQPLAEALASHNESCDWL
ncbi:HNH endonuclease [Ornithinimicrobium sufpigmenti]|uniref:HNH endonuclease n=1 Tax=Ornithinimicrobium sufpigmenti TaxID=2508882 RepID=UPI0010361AC5|nr:MULTISPECIES: HNH endonuclease [unclassified Ornithinimicrobium]